MAKKSDKQQNTTVTKKQQPRVEKVNETVQTKIFTIRELIEKADEIKLINTNTFTIINQDKNTLINDKHNSILLDTNNILMITIETTKLIDEGDNTTNKACMINVAPYNKDDVYTLQVSGVIVENGKYIVITIAPRISRSIPYDLKLTLIR